MLESIENQIIHLGELSVLTLSGPMHVKYGCSISLLILLLNYNMARCGVEDFIMVLENTTLIKSKITKNRIL